MSSPTRLEDAPVYIDYDVADRIATITLNRPEAANAQNPELLDELDAAWTRAAADSEVSVIVLRANGKHFSAGHDIGSPGRDIDKHFEHLATPWYPHDDKPGAERAFVREADAYLGLCRKWRDLPKRFILVPPGGLEIIFIMSIG